MRRSVTAPDILTFARLNMVYNQVRVIESKQNETDYKCLGSGGCCRIGLRLHMAECANIAFNLRQEYYLKLEDKGTDFANDWMNNVIESLKDAMYDQDWEDTGETTRHCAFYKGGCTIYGYRPLVCRSFGTITTVDDYCPRIRNAHGSIDYYSGDAVTKIIKEFQDLIANYSNDKDSSYNMVVYMPLGVLSFLLDSSELIELSKKTDQKFWSGVVGWYNYRVGFTKLHGYSFDELKGYAKNDGNPITFKIND
jgi:Fe-S-cluster containining protein